MYLFKVYRKPNLLFKFRAGKYYNLYKVVFAICIPLGEIYLDFLSWREQQEIKGNLSKVNKIPILENCYRYLKYLGCVFLAIMYIYLLVDQNLFLMISSFLFFCKHFTFVFLYVCSTRFNIYCTGNLILVQNNISS